MNQVFEIAKESAVRAFKEYFQPLVWAWNRLKIESMFVWNLLPSPKSQVTYSNKVKLAKAFRLAAIKGIRKWHFSFTEEYYKMTPNEKAEHYINAMHSLVLVDMTPENGFTPMDMTGL